MWIGVGKGKGGTGCTVTALELTYAATRRRRRVAYIDLDPQGDGTTVLEPTSRHLGIKDVLAPQDPLALSEVLVPSGWDGVLVAPADRFLANREADINGHGIAALRRARLSGEISHLVDDVVIDMPRHLGKLTAVGLLGTERLYITGRATMWGAQGAEEMRYSAQRIAAKGNPGLTVAGFIVTAYEENEDSRRVHEDMRQAFGGLIVDPPIPRNVNVSEAIESYHLSCREFGGDGMEAISDIYQGIYDRLHADEEGD